MSLENNHWSDKTKVLGANLTVTYDEHLPRGPINSVYLENTEGGAGTNGFVGTGVSRYQGKVGTDFFMDVAPIFLRALFEPLWCKNGGRVPAAADLAWEFDFSLLSQLLPQVEEAGVKRDSTVGLPGDSLKKWTTIFGAAGTVGVGIIGYEDADEPDWIPYLMPHTFQDMVDGAKVRNRHELMLQPLLCAGFVMDMGATEVAADGLTLQLADKNGVLQRQQTQLRRAQLLAKLKPFIHGDIQDPVFIPLDVPRVIEHHSVLYIDTAAAFLKTQEYLPVMFKLNPRGAIARGAAKVVAA